MEKIKNNELDLRRFFSTVKDNRPVYIASFIIIMAMAAVYCAVRMPQYNIHSAMLIEEPANDIPQASTGMTSLMRVFSIGSFGTSSVENEKLLLSSYDLKLRVVKLLGMNCTYTYRSGLKRIMLAPDEAPVSVSAPQELFDTLSYNFNLKVELHDGKADLSLSKGRFFKTNIADAKNVALPYTLETPEGTFHIAANGKTGFKGKKLNVAMSGYENCALDLDETVDIELAGRVSDALGLELVYPNKRLGINILNCIMAEYNNKRLRRKWDNADLEIKFYDERIASLFNELATAEKEIERFKRSHDLIAIEDEASLLVENEFASRQEIAELATARNYYESVFDLLDNGSADNTPLPVVSGLSIENSAGSMIERYNENILKRRELTRSAKGENRALKSLDSQLTSLREDIKAAMTEQIKASDLIISSHKKTSGAVAGRIKQLPSHEREYITLLRDQKLKNELYTFLLERRENAVLNRYSSATLGFVFQEAYCEGSDSHKIIIYSAAILLALLLPTIRVFYIMSRGRIKRPCDLNFYNLEESTVSLSKQPAKIDNLRSLLRKSPSRNIILYLNLDGGDITDILLQSLRNIGRHAESFSLDNSPQQTDELYTDTFEEKLKRLMEDGSYAIVELPRHINLVSLLDFSLADSSQLLLSMECGMQSRSYVRHLLSPVIERMPVTIALQVSD